MLAFSRLGKIGRLGNQLFQVAFITAFAERHGIEYRLPPWRYAEHFAHSFNITSLDDCQFDFTTREPGLGYHGRYFEALLPRVRRERVNIITGYFQSHLYFTKGHAQKIFRPKIPSPRFDRASAVAISVRRGDFVDHPFYLTIEANVYLSLLANYFPGFTVYIFSDDFAYCRKHFQGSHFHFCDNLSDIEQLFLMAQFENFVLSNSTFSYWGPMLANSPKLVLYPQRMFSDPRACDLYNLIFWPQLKEYVAFANPINKPLADMGVL